MTTLDQPNKLAAQPRNPFRWLWRWLAWTQKQDDKTRNTYESKPDRDYRADSQQAHAQYLAERSTRCL
jgi:hypothetical protein